jgi:hypothetical protein
MFGCHAGEEMCRAWTQISGAWDRWSTSTRALSRSIIETARDEAGMIELIDIMEVRYNCQDLSDLRSLLKQLVGQQFRFFKIAYGDELRLHLGAIQKYSNPRMKSRARGSYVIAVRASSWLVYSAPHRMLAASDHFDLKPGDYNSKKRVEIKTIEADGYITPGSIVTSVDAQLVDAGFALSIAFSDHSTALIMPSSDSNLTDDTMESYAENTTEMETSDWEILTPHARILTAGPGDRWNYLESSKKSL